MQITRDEIGQNFQQRTRRFM